MGTFHIRCGRYDGRFNGDVDLEKLNTSWKLAGFQVFDCDGSLLDRTAAKEYMLACVAKKFRCQRKANATIRCAKYQYSSISRSLKPEHNLPPVIIMMVFLARVIIGGVCIQTDVLRATSSMLVYIPEGLSVGTNPEQPLHH